MSQAGQFNIAADVETLTGNVGGAIIPVAGNIDILGGTGITVTGTPGTLTITHTGIVASSFPTDAGTAVPVAGALDILGGTNINTTGVGGTVTVVLDDTVTISGNFVSTAGDISATLGDITADAGDITATLGDISATGGSLTVGTTVTLTTITDGGLISDNVGNVTASAALSTFSGFATWAGAGAYFDDTVLGDFELLRGGTGYIKSVPVTWAGGQTTSGMTAGNTYFIYIDDTGTIGKTTSVTQATYTDNIVIFECLRDSTGTNIQYTVKENHPYDFLQATSFYLHEVIGTVIENNNQGANITLNGTQKIQINGADELADHGLYTTISDSSGVGVTWKQMLTNGSGKWITYTSSDTFDGTWNSAGTATAPSGNKFSIYTLYVSKDDLNAATPTYWAVLDDQEYNNLAAAQTAVGAGTMAISTTELQSLELCQLGHIIYQQSIDTIVDVIIEKATVRAVTAGGGASNDAALILTNTALFDGILSASDTNVQISLETIDEWGKTTTDHAVLIGNGTGSPIGSLAVGTNGQMLLGSTGADPVFANVTSTAGTIGITEGAGTLNLEADGLDQTNIYYVGKHGNDGNDGLTVNKAFLTFTAAQAAASGGDVVWCFDNGTYTENITGVASISLYAPNAELVGAHTITTNNVWTFRQMTVLTATTGVTMAIASQKASINLKRMTIAGIGVGIIVTSGTLFFRCGSIDVTNGFVVGSTTSDEIQMFFGEIHFLGIGVAFSSIAGGELMLFGDSVRNNGAGAGTVFSTSGGGTPIINATITSIDSDILSDITAGSQVSLNTCNMTGVLAESGAGTVVVGGAFRIDEVPIGAVTPSTGAFTTLSATTPLPVGSGGTGAVTLTDHSVLLGSGSGALTAIAVGATNEILIGNTGADASWSSAPTVTTLNATTLNATTVNGTTFDTNVVAAGVTLNATSLIADGTDANISINITAKGTGQVIIDDLQLTTDLVVTEGGTGAGTFTDHGVLIGSGTNAITAAAVGTNGQLLVGSTGADPVFATVASADASINFTLGAGTLDLSVSGTISINAQTGTTYEFLASDAGKLVTFDNAAAITATVPVNADVAIEIGATIVCAQKGAGTLTLAPEGGVTLSSAGAELDTFAQYSMVSIIKIDTNVWLVSGDTA